MEWDCPFKTVTDQARSKKRWRVACGVFRKVLDLNYLNLRKI